MIKLIITLGLLGLIATGNVDSLPITGRNEPKLLNEVRQKDATTYDLGEARYSILNPNEKPEIITADHPEYYENLRKYGPSVLEDQRNEQKANELIKKCVDGKAKESEKRLCDKLMKPMAVTESSRDSALTDLHPIVDHSDDRFAVTTPANRDPYWPLPTPNYRKNAPALQYDLHAAKSYEYPYIENIYPKTLY